jgi:hypothetical protein
MVFNCIQNSDRDVRIGLESASGDFRLRKEVFAVAAPWGVESDKEAFVFGSVAIEIERIQVDHHLWRTFGTDLGVVFDKIAEDVHGSVTFEFDPLRCTGFEEVDRRIAYDFVGFTDLLFVGTFNTTKSDVSEGRRGLRKIFRHCAAVTARSTVELDQDGIWASNQGFDVGVCDLNVFRSGKENKRGEEHLVGQLF